jgi:hypothetical protein
MEIGFLFVGMVLWYQKERRGVNFIGFKGAKMADGKDCMIIFYYFLKKNCEPHHENWTKGVLFGFFEGTWKIK